MADAASTSVATTYRRMLQLAKRLPLAERAGAVLQIRTQFRAGKAAQPDKVTDLLQLAHKKLSYLKMVTPKYQTRDVAGPEAGGAKRYAIVDGSVRELDAAGGAASTGPGSAGRQGSVDSDTLRRHQANLDRFQFKNRPAMPRSPYS